VKKRDYFDTVTNELREKLQGKAIAFEDLMAMLLNAYDAGMIDGVDMAFNELQPMSARHSEEAFDAALEVPKMAGKIHVEAYLNKPGGLREKAAKVVREWATGNYKNKDDCAERVSKKIGMSFSTARKHLRGTPNPDPWPAKSAGR
jgi:hypothetical protein